jgi:hypothetical protein
MSTCPVGAFRKWQFVIPRTERKTALQENDSWRVESPIALHALPALALFCAGSLIVLLVVPVLDLGWIYLSFAALGGSLFVRAGVSVPLILRIIHGRSVSHSGV